MPRLGHRIESILHRASPHAKLAIDLALVLASLIAYSILSHRVHGEEAQFLTLALAAFLILVSSHMATLILLPVAVIEIMLGMAAAGVGAEPGEGLLLLSNIGANLLLFMAGSEIDVKLLRRRARQALLLGALSFLAPSLIAYVIYRVYNLDTGSLLILVAGFSATSVALTYSMLKATGLISTRHGQLALTAAMVADILGMISLSIATASIDPTLVFYILILLAALAIGPLLPRVSGSPFELEIRLVAMTIIILGVMSELLGMHSVLTSFILGVVVSETVRGRRLFQEKLESLATGFFTPFFFIVSGMSVDPLSVAMSFHIILAIGLIVVALKMAPAYGYLSVTSRIHKRTAIIISSTQVPLLTVTIISGEAGLRLGLIDERIYTILMGTVVVTSIVSSYIMVRFSKR